MKQVYFLWGGVLLSIALSIIAICRTYPSYLEFDYVGIIFTAMSIVVTALIASQIVQYYQVEKKITEAAERAVNKSSILLANDIKQIIWASRYIFLARTFILEEKGVKAVHYYFKALDDYRNIIYYKLRESMAEDLITELYQFMGNWSKQDDSCIYADYKEKYIRLLNDYNGNLKNEIVKLLEEARTCSTDLAL